jgi:hypothetical protein
LQIPNARFQIPECKCHKNTGVATIANAFGILNVEFGILKDNAEYESLSRFSTSREGDLAHALQQIRRLAGLEQRNRISGNSV